MHWKPYTLFTSLICTLERKNKIFLDKQTLKNFEKILLLTCIESLYVLIWVFSGLFSHFKDLKMNKLSHWVPLIIGVLMNVKIHEQTMCCWLFLNILELELLSLESLKLFIVLKIWWNQTFLSNKVSSEVLEWNSEI